MAFTNAQAEPGPRSPLILLNLGDLIFDMNVTMLNWSSSFHSLWSPGLTVNISQRALCTPEIGHGIIIKLVFSSVILRKSF